MDPPGRGSRCQEGGEKAITSRLRRLGMGYDYDVSGSGPRMSMLLLTRIFQCYSKLKGESHEYANRVRGHQLPDNATERAQTLDMHVCEITQTMKAAPLKGTFISATSPSIAATILLPSVAPEKQHTAQL